MAARCSLHDTRSARARPSHTTMLRTPCVHVLCALGSRGLPLGVTVVGPIQADRVTLMAANWVQAKIGLADN